MRKISYLILISLILINITGCLGALIVGGAAGAMGAYAVSKDTLVGDTDKPYNELWHAALVASDMRGAERLEDHRHGYIELKAGATKVWIRLIRLTRSTTRVRVSARKYHLPDMNLAQDIFVKIVGQKQ